MITSTRSATPGPDHRDRARRQQPRTDRPVSAKGQPGAERACEALVARYQSLVRACAQRYRDSPESPEELMQVGYVGLLKAINNFDPAVGDKLAAYAQPCVSGEIKRYFRDKRWEVRVRRPVQELRLEIRKATADLTQQLGRTPTDADLASHLNISEDRVREAQQAALAFQASSLDAPLPDSRGETRNMSEILGAEDPDLSTPWTWQRCGHTGASSRNGSRNC